MLTLDAPSQPTMLVACLCADWCGTCRDYRPLFDQLAARFPAIAFLWIDVEEESELVDPIEVENFPTLLMATREQVRFLGPVVPHWETVQRLIETQLAPDASRLPDSADRDDLTQRLWERVSL